MNFRRLCSEPKRDCSVRGGAYYIAAVIQAVLEVENQRRASVRSPFLPRAYGLALVRV